MHLTTVIVDPCPPTPIMYMYEKRDLVNNLGSEPIEDLVNYIQGKFDGENNFMDL